MSDDTFTSGFQAGQQLGELLRQSTPPPALLALAIGLLDGLREGAALAQDILKTQLDHEINEAQLEREHQAKQAAYSRRMEDYTNEREDA